MCIDLRMRKLRTSPRLLQKALPETFFKRIFSEDGGFLRLGVGVGVARKFSNSQRYLGLPTSDSYCSKKITTKIYNLCIFEMQGFFNNDFLHQFLMLHVPLN